MRKKKLKLLHLYNTLTRSCDKKVVCEIKKLLVNRREFVTMLIMSVVAH